jgi:hypothetical protein
MLFNGGGNRTTGIPLTGSGIIGGNLGGSTFGEPEKPKKKSKRGLILVLSSVVLLAGLAITGWQLGWFKWGVEPPVVAGTTTNAEPTKGTGNVTVNPQPIENSPLNPEDYTVKSGSDAILTEKGLLHNNNRYYRYLNGQWEFSEKSNKNNWKTATEKDIEVILDKYFDKNKTPSPSPQPPGPQPPAPQPPGPQPPKPPLPDVNECTIKKANLILIEGDAVKAAKILDPTKKKAAIGSLQSRLDAIKNSGTSCDLNLTKVQIAINNLR